jgi:DNA-binding MarR family transcriptional regulator
MGLSPEDEARLGPERATRVRTFRLILNLAQRMRTSMDKRLRADGLTTQQAALISIVDSLGTPSLSDVSRWLGTTHQNARQIADALERKGFVRITADAEDARVRRLRTTERSRTYWRRRSATDQEHVVDWFAGLSSAEVTTLFDLLYRITQNLSIELEAGGAGAGAGDRVEPAPPAAAASPQRRSVHIG